MATRNRDISKRMNWFERQFLRAQDFIDEQDYWLDRHRRHNRLLHSPGVADGLNVSGTVGASSVKVAPGTAVDGQGRELILTTQKPKDLPGPPATKAEVYLVYAEAEADPSEDPGVTGKTRIHESPDVKIRTTAPAAEAVPADGVLLAEVELDNGSVANNPNNDVRDQAGTNVGESLTVSRLTLKNNAVNPAQWPQLTCSAAAEARISGSLKLDNQREISFQDGGQIRSFDNFHKLVFNRPNNRLELHEFGDILFLTGNPPSEKMRILANGNVAIGAAQPSRRLHVEPSEIHCGGAVGGFSFGNRQTPAFVETPANGERWVWYASGGIARLWSGADKVFVAPNGNVGIGVPIPTTDLDVAGAVKAQELRTTLHAAGGTGAATLATNNQWANFPDLTKTFSIPAATVVLVFYQITMHPPGAVDGNAHLVTQLVVDGQAQTNSRSITGNTQYWSPCNLWMGRLAAGQHTITVQYRTPAGGVNSPAPPNDWHNRTLQILVFGA